MVHHTLLAAGAEIMSHSIGGKRTPMTDVEKGLFELSQTEHPTKFRWICQILFCIYLNQMSGLYSYIDKIYGITIRKRIISVVSTQRMVSYLIILNSTRPRSGWGGHVLLKPGVARRNGCLPSLLVCLRETKPTQFSTLLGGLGKSH
jgi:hypothetical protein